MLYKWDKASKVVWNRQRYKNHKRQNVDKQMEKEVDHRICSNCRWFQYSLITNENACVHGHSISEPDWRHKYSICDQWEGINDRHGTDNNDVQRQP